MRLLGTRALVTGATSGIGKSIAKLYLENGAHVAVNYHKEDDRKKRTEEEFGRLLEDQGGSSERLIFVNADVSEESEVDGLFSEVISRFGGLDLLVNNAAIEGETASHELETSRLFRELSVTLGGTLLCTLAAIRHFIERKKDGHIINNSSVHEIIPKPGYLPYSVAKGGVRSMTRTLALEYARSGIRVNSVGPGVVDTALNEGLEDPNTRKEVTRHIPTGKIIEPEEVAQAFLFLASDEAKHITGQTIFVDGGLTLYPDFRINWSSR